MLTWIREKFGTTVIGIIIGLIAAVFVFYGVFSPSSTRGVHEGSVAGKVNGESISITEYNRELNRRLEFFKSLGGGQISEAQLKMFRVREGVFDELARRKIMVQQAYKDGMLASDEQVRQSITEMSVFQTDGHFDLSKYRQVLEANQYSPGTFERLMREDLSVQRWNDYFRRRSVVTPEEARKEFLVQHDKRTIKYVILNTETGRHGVNVGADDLKKFLADAAKVNVAKGQFESRKGTEFKGKTFDDVKEQIARELIAGERLSDIEKVNQKVADEIKGLLKADKASDAKVEAILKPYHAELRTSAPISRNEARLPGVTDTKELIKDAFAEKSPIDPSQGGQAKEYKGPGTVLVALVSSRQTPDLAKFETERPTIMRQLAGRKQQELFQDWIKGLTEHAKIEMNKQIVGGEEDAG